MFIFSSTPHLCLSFWMVRRMCFMNTNVSLSHCYIVVTSIHLIWTGIETHWHLHTSVFERSRVVWFVTIFTPCIVSVAHRQGKLHQSWATHVFIQNDSMIALLWDEPCDTMMISEIWRPALIPLEGLCIRVSTRHLDILVRMFLFRRILAHCNDLLLIVDTMLFIGSLS